MQRSTLSGQRLVAVFLLGCIFFNYPVLSLFDRAATLLGVPLVFLYLFAAWGLVIVLMAWVVEHRERHERREHAEPRERREQLEPRGVPPGEHSES
jgi:hypothetical protein